ACPLALNSDGGWAEQSQRALVRYYMDAGAGGLAVGVHSTQFAIREPRYGLYRPVLQLAAEVMDAVPQGTAIKVAGICGGTKQAAEEAEVCRLLGYHAGLVSLKDFATADDETMLTHVQTIASIIPVMGFYLQPAVGGRLLSYEFWRKFAEI